ncbi:lipase 1 [Asbolus verrucosus]|uniref:Lipase n=1 Tax=Asbolus verrucosus TaxID=1661398 RepID=A0A482V853_ASBVE|nr:lipase 1 [Asbolus verrucosus]
MATRVVILILGVICGISSSVIPFDDSDVGLNTVEIIENHGYVCENHYITTEDGYILTYQRIPHGKNDDGSGKKPAILLMHGLASSSADYVNMGPNRSISYILADIGYDVWIGNSRGNAWSRNHTTLDVVTDNEQFYDFSWHQIGYYDLPAAVDYILSVNGGDGLQYVGHSQGCTSFLVFASTRPEYNDKIKLASLMGPASIMEYHPNEILQVISNYIYDIEKLLKKYKIFELPLIEKLREIALSVCTNPENWDLCGVLFDFVGHDEAQFDTSLLPVLFTNLPSNFGFKQVLHYGQQIKNGGFSQYDFGREKNMEIYGAEKPPAYDLTKITAPVAVYYGKNDGLVNYMDVKTVISMLSNVANDYLIPHEAFNHIDFITATDVVDLLYVEMIQVMQKY